VIADGLPRDFPPLRGTVSQLGDARRVVLADDSVLLREGVARLLEDAGFEVVAQSGTAEDLLRHVAMHKPDVAVVDIRMPPTHTDEGLRAAREIRERHPGVGVLLLSQYVEPRLRDGAAETSAEGVGYLLKDRVADLEQFGTAVRRVADGGSALDPAVVSELVGRKRRDDPLEQLTAREREVLELMAEGRSNQAIAERLFVTLRAVEKHVTSIFTKLGLPASTDDHRRVLAVPRVPPRVAGPHSGNGHAAPICVRFAEPHAAGMPKRVARCRGAHWSHGSQLALTVAFRDTRDRGPGRALRPLRGDSRGPARRTCRPRCATRTTSSPSSSRSASTSSVGSSRRSKGSPTRRRCSACST
jgi:DNA-binding NarL/FixJ family response regulator